MIDYEQRYKGKFYFEQFLRDVHFLKRMKEETFKGFGAKGTFSALYVNFTSP